jgi:hypothetical protein
MTWFHIALNYHPNMCHLFFQQLISAIYCSYHSPSTWCTFVRYFCSSKDCPSSLILRHGCILPLELFWGASVDKHFFCLLVCFLALELQLGYFPLGHISKSLSLLVLSSMNTTSLTCMCYVQWLICSPSLIVRKCCPKLY